MLGVLLTIAVCYSADAVLNHLLNSDSVLPSLMNKAQRFINSSHLSE